jgi:hypothetical protein
MKREHLLETLVAELKTFPDAIALLPSNQGWSFIDGKYVHTIHDPITIDDWNRAKIKPNTKIRILSEEHRGYVQKLAFESGHEWGAPLSESDYLNVDFMFFWEDELLGYSYDEEYFEGHVYKEIFIEMPKETEHTNINAKVLAEKVNAIDVQMGGDHYKDQPIQPVQYIHANNIGYFEGNVIKYVSRWKKKNGIADLEKAKHYIELLIELEENKQ